jgi:hypothetical protein
VRWHDGGGGKRKCMQEHRAGASVPAPCAPHLGLALGAASVTLVAILAAVPQAALCPALVVYGPPVFDALVPRLACGAWLSTRAPPAIHKAHISRLRRRPSPSSSPCGGSTASLRPSCGAADMANSIRPEQQGASWQGRTVGPLHAAATRRRRYRQPPFPQTDTLVVAASPQPHP